MPAYILIKVQANNPEKLKDYQSIAPAIIKKYGGKFLARGGKVLTLEGKTESRRCILIEFASLEATKRFYDSPEYTEAIKLRQDIASFEIIALEGLT